jgi:endonuclease/exonuclease/phosphatase family metal-dependent hydrolase
LNKSSRYFFIGLHISIGVLFLFASIFPSLQPSEWSFTGFAGLIYPYLLVFFLLSTLLLIRISSILTIFSCLLLISSYKNIAELFAFKKQETFSIEKPPRAIRVLDWNVRTFTPYDVNNFDLHKSNYNEIVAEIAKYNPDIICLQEFFSDFRNQNQNIKHFYYELGFCYIATLINNVRKGGQESGAIILSKYPIFNSFKFDLPEQISTADETPIGADIVVGKDTIRIVTFHMQSFGFLNKEYKDLATLKTQENDIFSATTRLYHKMQYAFKQRGKQVEIIKERISESPYPLIVCGDLNDVPHSYAYKTIKANRKDAFLEKGFGIGKTFTGGRSKFISSLPTLRIDYIFADQSFEVNQFKIIEKRLSDHLGIISDLSLYKK